MNYPYGVHMAVVRVDRDTGGMTIERYFIAYDVGRAVNPDAGARDSSPAAWLRASAARCSKNSSTTSAASRCASTFADYLMPTAREVPAARCC